MGLLAWTWSNVLGSIIQRICGDMLISVEGDKSDYMIYIYSPKDQLDFIKNDNIFKIIQIFALNNMQLKNSKFQFSLKKFIEKWFLENFNCMFLGKYPNIMC
jgi:hypothetical protein